MLAPGSLSQVSQQPRKPQPWGQRSPVPTFTEGQGGRIAEEGVSMDSGPGAPRGHRLQGSREGSPAWVPRLCLGGTVWQLGLSCVRAHLHPRGAGGACSPHKQLPPPEGPVISNITHGSSNLRVGAGRRVLGQGPPDAQGSLVPTAPLGSLWPMQLCGAAARGETHGSGDPSPITGYKFRARAGSYVGIPSCTSWGASGPSPHASGLSLPSTS